MRGTVLRNAERELYSLSHIIRRSAEIHPDRIAIDDLRSQRRLTYRELDERSNRLANALSRAGVGCGDFVALMFYNEHAMIESMFAVAKLGAVFCPVNIRLLPAETANYVNFNGCKAVLCHVDFTAKFADCDASLLIAKNDSKDLPEGWASYEAILESGDATPPPVETSALQAVRVLQTGGTTGASKAVLNTSCGTLFTVLGAIAEFGIGRHWQTIAVAPAYHGAGTDWNIFPILWRGGTVVFLEDAAFNPGKFFHEIRARDVEYLVVVPALILALYSNWDKQPLTRVRSIVTTSAPTLLAQRRQLKEMFPDADIRAAAGISENLNMASQSPDEFIEHPGSVGEPFLDTRLLVVDATGHEAVRGQPGEICLRGFNSGLGYHRQDEPTRMTWRRLPDDPEGVEWLFTGDIGVMDEEGRVSIIDRSKDVILSGGETVPSVEIESVYSVHPYLKECAAIGTPHEKWGEAITLVCVKSDPMLPDDVLVAGLIEFGRSHIAPYKIPKRFAVIDALPRSHFGKVLKNALRSGKLDMISI